MSSDSTSGQAARKQRAKQRKTSQGDRKIAPELMNEWKEAFAMFDKNGDGTISFDEFTQVMRLLGNNPTDSELEEMMDTLDADKNGVIDFQEFKALLTLHWRDPEDEETELRDAFKVFDRNNDGYVVADEIKFVMSQLGQCLTDDEIRQTIAKADLDGDGRLNYNEFVKVMQAK